MVVVTYVIGKDDLRDGQVVSLLHEHYLDMLTKSPIESVHALTADDIKQSGVEFWSVRAGNQVVACCGLNVFSEGHAELKSMKTSQAHTKKGLAAKLLAYVLDEAKGQGVEQVSLETGSQDSFLPAKRLYQKFGFHQTQPFGDYTDDPNSYFMTKTL